MGPSRLIVLHPEIGGRLTLISKVCLLVLILLSLPAVVKSKKNIFLFVVSIAILLVVKFSVRSSGAAFGGLSSLYLLFLFYQLLVFLK